MLPADHAGPSGLQLPPLGDVARHFALLSHSPSTQGLLQTVLRLCPPGAIALELEAGAGLASVWLSLRGVAAEGMSVSPVAVEHARQASGVLGGSATYRVGDPFALYAPGREPIHVIHHQGLLEHDAVPWVRALVAQQIASARWVVFTVPSVYYPLTQERGDERLLPLDEWQKVLEPFHVEELRYVGDEREHILGVLKGQAATPELMAMMRVPEEPYPFGISAIVHTRNEASRIAECLETLNGWTDEVIVCDMESTDETVEIARRFTDQIVQHPLIRNFDRSRNVSAMRARYRWVFYLDADERVPTALGAMIRDLVTSHGDTFEAALPPFRHCFAGQWLTSLYPGYTAPRLFKNGRFHFNARLHSGAHVDGRMVRLPAENPDLAILHQSYDSISHYLEKVNRYTDGEAENMHRDGQPFHWQGAVRHLVEDLRSYYDHRAVIRADGARLRGRLEQPTWTHQP